MAGELAPPLDVTEWLNSPPLQLSDLTGQVVLVKTFQMLCPGCVSYGIPQAQRVQRTFRSDQVAVLGLHTVFEHHDVMGPDALRVFLHEYRITFPVAIDRNDGADIPVTMRTYGLQGTPSTLLIDRAGKLRETSFGAVDDLALGTSLGRLLTEDHSSALPDEPGDDVAQAAAVCVPGAGCN